jgi:hypothetical protein
MSLPSDIAPTSRFWGPTRDPNAPTDPIVPPPVVYSSSAPAPPSVTLSPNEVGAYLANYICRHCAVNLSTGNILESMKAQFPQDTDEVNEQRARSFGWTPERPTHYFRVEREMNIDRMLVFVCPDCHKKDPFGTNEV